MNPMILFVALAVAAFAWSLTMGLRSGEFRFGNGSYRQTIVRIRRDDAPTVFWILAAFHVGLILYVASFVFEM